MNHGKPPVCPAVLQLLLLVSAAGAQTGSVPPNPVPVPRMEAPSLQTPLSVPTVTAPVLSAPARSTAAAGKSVLPDSLDEMTSPLTLLNVLSGSGTDGEGLDALSALLGTSGTAAAQTAAAQTATAAPAAAAAKVRPASGGEIVRFIVNRTDIAAGSVDVVSSALAKDGSFLLTGRRPNLGEIFYLVCKKTGSGTYRLFADLGQDYQNEKSWLYQLVRKTPLEGTLTGDLLVFRTGDPEWALDLVIRVITPTVPAATVR